MASVGFDERGGCCSEQNADHFVCFFWNALYTVGW